MPTKPKKENMPIKQVYYTFGEDGDEDDRDCQSCGGIETVIKSLNRSTEEYYDSRYCKHCRMQNVPFQPPSQ